MRPTLFQQALGAAYFRLPDSLRRLHAPDGRARWTGVATVERGDGALARLCAAVTGLPKTASGVATTVDFVADARGETWWRDFGGQRMRTRMALKHGLLRERLGPLQLRHALHANNGAIWWTVAGARLFGLLPLPASLFDGVRCREFERDGRYHFEVEARLPLAGEVIRYSGWLVPGPAGDSGPHPNPSGPAQRAGRSDDPRDDAAQAGHPHPPQAGEGAQSGCP